MSEEIKENEEKELTTEEVVIEEDKIKLLEQELEEYKKAYTLKLAEFQNFTKRKEKEIQDFKEFANKDLIVKVLDNLDNLERAIVASTETKNYEVLVEGLKMSINNLLEILKNEGVSEIEALDKDYDAQLHHAVGVENIENVENNKVTKVFQKGYKLKNKVIRPSMVLINKIEEKIEENLGGKENE